MGDLAPVTWGSWGSWGSVGRVAAEQLGIADRAFELVSAATSPVPWSSHLPVGALATDSVALASVAMALLQEERGIAEATPFRIDPARVAASFGSERIIRIDGQAPPVWAPLSGFWETADGWVRTHANYPHHERALRSVLGVAEDAEKPAISAAISEWSAEELEDRAAERSAVVAAVRTPAQWRAHPHAHAIASDPLVRLTRAAGSSSEATPRVWSPGTQPLSGIRVLDLTRVIAGPVAARDLAFAGAEVLRVDSPHHAELGWIHLGTGQGKRSTLLDLDDRHDRDVFERLLAQADVLLTGYRPGALTRFGLDPDAVAERHPGLVSASVSAWGSAGPWAARRGFDSIVQAATGISLAESPGEGRPGALPAQALDHATGHLLSAAIAMALREQRRTGGSFEVRASLAGTARALLGSPDPVESAPSAADLPARERTVPDARPWTLTYAPPVLAYPGAPADYREVGGRWGVDLAEWTGMPG